MEELKSLLNQKGIDDLQQEMFERHKYVTTEYQDYGYRLAAKLGDLKHKALYIKLAKEKPRALLETAFSFAIDYPAAKNKGRIFMWKLKDLQSGGKKDLAKKTPKRKNTTPKKIRLTRKNA